MPLGCGANSILFFSCPELMGAQAMQDASRGTDAIHCLVKGRSGPIRAGLPLTNHWAKARVIFLNGNIPLEVREALFINNHSCAPKQSPKNPRKLLAHTLVSFAWHSMPSQTCPCQPSLRSLHQCGWPFTKHFQEYGVPQLESYSPLISPEILLLKPPLCANESLTLG